MRRRSSWGRRQSSRSLSSDLTVLRRRRLRLSRSSAETRADMIKRLQHHREDEGFSLIELMVVIMLTAVIGGVVSVSLITAMQTTRQDQSRGNASNALQTVVEQISRDVRVADPLRSVSTSDVILDR